MQKKKFPPEPKPIANAVAATSGPGPQVVATQKSEAFAGPLPHPETLQQYEKILPVWQKESYRWQKQSNGLGLTL